MCRYQTHQCLLEIFWHQLFIGTIHPTLLPSHAPHYTYIQHKLTQGYMVYFHGFHRISLKGYSLSSMEDRRHWITPKMYSQLAKPSHPTPRSPRSPAREVQGLQSSPTSGLDANTHSLPSFLHCCPSASPQPGVPSSASFIFVSLSKRARC